MILALAACKRDDPPPAGFLVPIEDRSRYVDCVSESVGDFGFSSPMFRTTEYDGLGWVVDDRSGAGDGTATQIDQYEGRNEYGLYTRWTSEAVGVSTESTTATYLRASWTTRDLAIDGRVAERWVYSQPSERELTAEVDLDADGVVERSWRQTLNDDGRPEAEALADVDGRPVSDGSWTWDDERLLEEVHHDVTGGWTASYTWGGELGPDSVSMTTFDESGTIELLSEGSFTYDDEGRERASTYTLDFGGEGVVDDEVEWTWTWTCP